MRTELEKRLKLIECKGTDWAQHLDYIDYGVVEVDYKNSEWEELHFDNFITAVRHRKTGEIRGYYFDRRTHEEMEADGGDLQFL